MNENNFIYFIGNIIGYFLNYLIFIQTLFISKNEYHNTLLFKNLNNKCDINDSTSCQWSLTRCATFSDIIIRCLIPLDSTQQLKLLKPYYKLKTYISKNILTTSNLITIMIYPDHIFNVIKINNTWYYISSWMLLYKGVIIKIENFEIFIDTIDKYFIDVELINNRKKSQLEFEIFINKYFITKLQINPEDTFNYIKINNFSILSQLLFIGNQSSVFDMLNIISSKSSDKSYYDVYISINSSNILDKFDLKQLINSIYVNYVENINNKLLNTQLETYTHDYYKYNINQNTEVIDDYNELYSLYNDINTCNTDIDIFNLLSAKFINIQLYGNKRNVDSGTTNIVYGTNKYKTKTLYFINTNFNKLLSTINNVFNESQLHFLTTFIKTYIIKDTQHGGNSSSMFLQSTEHIKLNPDSYILNQLFFGKTIVFHNIGVSVKDDVACDILNIIKYTTLINHLDKFKQVSLFYNLSERLFNSNSTTYTVSKKYYYFLIDNSYNYICVITFNYPNIIINHQLILFNMNNATSYNINIIFPETTITTTKDIKVNINQFIVTNGIYIFDTFDNIELFEIDNTKLVNSDTSIDFCNELSIIKQYIMDKMSPLNIKHNYYILIQIIQIIAELTNNNNIIEILNKYIVIFDIIRLLFDSNINFISNSKSSNSDSYKIDIGEHFIEHLNAYDFYKKTYLDLKQIIS